MERWIPMVIVVVVVVVVAATNAATVYTVPSLPTARDRSIEEWTAWVNGTGAWRVGLPFPISQPGTSFEDWLRNVTVSGFAFVRPAGHALHRRLVVRKNSFFEGVARKSASEQVRFDLYRDREDALVRHRSMEGRPDEILVLSACDFFMTSFRAFWASNFMDRMLALGRKKSRSPSR